jgi:hypothetical protein
VTGSYQSCTSPVTYSSLADGSYTFVVRAIDAVGNTDDSPATRSFTIVPPAGPAWPPAAPRITSPSSYSWVKGTLTISGTAEPGSTVEVRDGSLSFGTTVATASGTWTRQVTGIADNTYLLTARATNLGGTSPESAAVVVRYDATAPEAPVFTAPDSTVGRSFTLAGTAESGVTVELFENGVSRGTLASGSAGWTRQMWDVTTGVHYYTARAIDFAGNASSLSAPFAVRVSG